MEKETKEVTAVQRAIEKREFTSGTLCELDAEGYWKVTSTITDKVKFADSDEWVNEILQGVAIDRDYKNAIAVAMSSCLSYMQDNIYDKGFNGLVEYREFERNFKDASEAKNL